MHIYKLNSCFSKRHHSYGVIAALTPLLKKYIYLIENLRLMSNPTAPTYTRTQQKDREREKNLRKSFGSFFLTIKVPKAFSKPKMFLD